MKHIKAYSWAMLVLVLFTMSLVIPAHADNDKLDFTLVNKTGYGIKGIYCGPSSSDDWGDNLLEKPLENGESLAITFSPKAKAEKWDLRIEWVDPDDAVNWKGFKLSEITKITLHYNRSTGETTAETE